MQDNEFTSKLSELMGNLSVLPPTERAKLEQLAAQTRQRHDKLRLTVKQLQDSLDTLRVSIKYLVFDLEATRRENQYLKGLLEDKAE